MMSFAAPSIACATALAGYRSCAAIWLRDRPWSTWGEKLDPVMTYRLAMSRKGMLPCGSSSPSAPICAAVGVWRAW